MKVFSLKPTLGCLLLNSNVPAKIWLVSGRLAVAAVW